MSCLLVGLPMMNVRIGPVAVCRQRSAGEYAVTMLHQALRQSIQLGQQFRRNHQLTRAEVFLKVRHR
jgi:hypothetical protein